MTEVSYKYALGEVISAFVDDPNFERPNKFAISNASKVLSKYPETRNALGICRELSKILDLEATSTLAVMFHEKHSSLPAQWVEEPDLTRTILSMSASISLGFLRAIQLYQKHFESNSYTDKEVKKTEKLDTFARNLQVKNKIESIQCLHEKV